MSAKDYLIELHLIPTEDKTMEEATALANEALRVLGDHFRLRTSQYLADIRSGDEDDDV